MAIGDALTPGIYHSIHKGIVVWLVVSSQGTLVKVTRTSFGTGADRRGSYWKTLTSFSYLCHLAGAAHPQLILNTDTTTHP